MRDNNFHTDGNTQNVNRISYTLSTVPLLKLKAPLAAFAWGGVRGNINFTRQSKVIKIIFERKQRRVSCRVVAQSLKRKRAIVKFATWWREPACVFLSLSLQPLSLSRFYFWVAFSLSLSLYKYTRSLERAVGWKSACVQWVLCWHVSSLPIEGCVSNKSQSGRTLQRVGVRVCNSITSPAAARSDVRHRRMWACGCWICLNSDNVQFKNIFQKRCTAYLSS